MLHITDVKAFQAKINASSKEKMLQAAAKDNVLQGQASIKNGVVAETNSSVVDLAAFNTKAAILAALQHVKNVKHTLHRLGSSFQSQGPSKGQAISRGGMAGYPNCVLSCPLLTQAFKHASIAMADVGARAVHARIPMLRAQALNIGTSTHGQGLALTKDIPISTTGLFGGDLSKAVAKAA